MLFSYFHLEIRLTWTSRFGHGGKLESSRVAVSAGPVPARCWPLRANIGPAPSGRCRLPGFNNLQLVTFHMSVVANIRWTYHCGCFCVACMNILVWTQRVKPGFMHALGNIPTLNLVLRGSLDHRTVSRSVGSQNGADPGSLGLSGAPDTGPWTPYPPPPRCSSFLCFLGWLSWDTPS